MKKLFFALLAIGLVWQPQVEGMNRFKNLFKKPNQGIKQQSHKGTPKGTPPSYKQATNKQPFPKKTGGLFKQAREKKQEIGASVKQWSTPRLKSLATKSDDYIKEKTAKREQSAQAKTEVKKLTDDASVFKTRSDEEQKKLLTRSELLKQPMKEYFDRLLEKIKDIMTWKKRYGFKIINGKLQPSKNQDKDHIQILKSNLTLDLFKIHYEIVSKLIEYENGILNICFAINQLIMIDSNPKIVNYENLLNRKFNKTLKTAPPQPTLQFPPDKGAPPPPPPTRSPQEKKNLYNWLESQEKP